MTTIGLYYGSNDGTTEDIAYRIKDQIDNLAPGMVEVFNIGQVKPGHVLEWDYLIFGAPTWYIGELQDDWEFFLPGLEELDFSGKKVALFGLGDQYGYSSTYLDAIGLIAEVLIANGAELVGMWPVDGYHFEASLAQVDDHFLGLALDEDNEYKLTDERIQAWILQVLEEFGLEAGIPA